ncbi:SAM-dependent methyltransferase [Nonomuraea typhae]|uniref:SAM-dependent methyltransferase n=1 Tax=Nonomuraea typhae TaxID=2603600 RepID=UPI0015E21DAA|nr:SAM-dependent methyltransferase [Nonomuraea typhae]
MIDPVAGTARWTAAMRAEESARPDRLFDDPFATLLAGEDGRARLSQDGSTPAITIRTRFFDDVIAKSTPPQFVLIAAGMDTRAYRLGLPPATTVYELDRPELLRLKDGLLHDAGAVPTCARRSVGTDLTGDWDVTLAEAGFDPNRPTLWSAEGLTQYLDAADVTGLIERITELSAPGSELLIDFIGQSLLDSDEPERRAWLDRLIERGTPWHFGTDRPEDLLEPEWAATVTTLSSVGKALGRWPGPDVPRETPGSPHVFLIHAHRRLLGRAAA